MSVRRPTLLLALTCVAVLAAPTVAAAGPPRVACGATLTTSTVLRHDLTCTGDGLYLAPGVTLDLRGHTLRGSGTGTGVLVASEGAIAIRNGTLTGWRTAVDTVGIEDTDTGPLTIDRLRVRDNHDGVDTSGDDGTGLFRKPTTITRSTFTGHTGTAVPAAWFVEVEIVESRFADNDVGVWSEGDATIRQSHFVRNQRAVIGTEASVVIERSVFTDNPVAVQTHIIGGLWVRESRFTGSQDAVDAGGAVFEIASSTFVGNQRAIVLGQYGGSVTDNVLRRNGDAISGTSEWYDPTVVRGNVLRQNREGIVLDPAEAAENLQVGDNDVRGSTGWGIYVPGATDLGGNTARGNGNEPQCVGVDCGSPRS